MSNPTTWKDKYVQREGLKLSRTNKTEEAQNTAKDLYNENFDKQIGVCSVCERRSRPSDTNTDTA